MNFILLDLSEDNDKSISQNKFWDKLNLSERFHRFYNIKKTPIHKSSIFYYGIEGEIWKLPFTVDQAKEKGKEFMNNQTYQIYAQYPDNRFVLSTSLKQCMGKRYRDEPTGLLMLLIFPDLFEFLVDKYRISCKDMRLVVVDSGNQKTEYILDLFLEYLNYLTILTNRPEYFMSLADQVYEDTGLSVEILNISAEDCIYGNVIIDLNVGDYSYYKYVKNTELIIDLASYRKKSQYIRNQCKNIPIIEKAEISIHEEQVKNLLLTEEILRSSFSMLEVLWMGLGVIRYEELSYIREQMAVKLIK